MKIRVLQSSTYTPISTSNLTNDRHRPLCKPNMCKREQVASYLPIIIDKPYAVIWLYKLYFTMG